MSRAPLTRVRLSRRDLLKVMQVGGVGAAAAGVAALGPSRAEASQVRATCRLCTMHCGVVATVRGRELVRMEGDPDAPTRGFICIHGRSMPDLVHHPARVATPLVRDGDAWVPVGWDAAIRHVAQSMLRIREQHGAGAVAVQTGWPFVRHPLVPFLHRFCTAFGTPNLATVASLCESSARMARVLTTGVNHWPDVARARTLLVWGAQPHVTAPPFAAMMAQAGRKGRHLVVVDPVRTEMAALASLHLQPRPGTDGILCMGMIRVVLDGGMANRAFIQEHVHGMEALRAAVEPWPLERVARVTGVPADKITTAATWFAQDGPSAAWEGLGIEHHVDGVQAGRAIGALQAICGHLDGPGSALPHGRPGPAFWDSPLTLSHPLRLPLPHPPACTEPPIGRERYPLFELFNRQAQADLFPDAMLDGNPRPLRGLILMGSNPAVTSPDSTRMRRALGSLDLLVSINPFLDETAQLADVVLPASTFAESPAVLDAEREEAVDAQGLVPPQGEAWPDWKIMFTLARALGMERYFPWQTFAEAMAAPREPVPVDPAREHHPDPRPAATPPPRWATPTGRVEVESTLLARLGLPAVPVFQEPAPAPEGFPLQLVTGPRTRAFINSQFHDVRAVTRRVHHAEARLHPDTAVHAGVANGKQVRVTSASGSVVFTAVLDPGVLQGVVVVPGGFGNANANVLTGGVARDPLSGFPAFRSTWCRVETA